MKKSCIILMIIMLTGLAGISCGQASHVGGTFMAVESETINIPSVQASGAAVDVTEEATEFSTGGTDSDAPFLVLVNFEHPIYSEPPVVLLSEYLTAANTVCDPRRHANETAAKALNEMLTAAEGEGDFHFIIASAFRYIWEQRMMWEGKIAEEPDYGKDPYANPVKLMPTNCSEHTTGLAFDILCRECPHSDVGYANTAEGRWLAANAHRFGFILRYPADKQHITGVQFEPWHFRYVGKDAAQYIYSHSLCLEEYLGRP